MTQGVDFEYLSLVAHTRRLFLAGVLPCVTPLQVTTNVPSLPLVHQPSVLVVQVTVTQDIVISVTNR